MEVARLEELRATVTFYWMGCLLGGPHGPPGSDEDARQQREAWSLWRSVVDRLALDARVRAEARADLEARYLGGRHVLFPDAAAAWAGYREQVFRWRRPSYRVCLGELVVAKGLAPEGNGLHGRDSPQVLDDRDRALKLLEQELPVPPQQDDGVTSGYHTLWRRGVLQHHDRHPRDAAAQDRDDVAAHVLQTGHLRTPEPSNRPGRLADALGSFASQPCPFSIGSCGRLLPGLDLDRGSVPARNEQGIPDLADAGATPFDGRMEHEVRQAVEGSRAPSRSLGA